MAIARRQGGSLIRNNQRQLPSQKCAFLRAPTDNLRMLLITEQPIRNLLITGQRGPQATRGAKD